MKISLISNQDPINPDNYSGTPYYIIQSLTKQNVQVDYAHISFSSPTRYERFQQFLLKYTGKNQSATMRYAQYCALKIEKILRDLKTDAILMNPWIVGALVETKTPIFYWTDIVFTSFMNFYPDFICRYTEPDIYTLTHDCLKKAKLLLFSSGWAARSAIEMHGISKSKIRIVPFGANLDISHSLGDVRQMIKVRSRRCIKFLFVGKEWYRKGGDIVLRIAKQLHIMGHAIEVTLVGCDPEEHLPPYVRVEGLISKNSQAERDKIRRLYQDAHFLFVPSRAEAYGIVFCEANAFGVPCLTTSVGGIPEVVKDGINGMKFSLEATVKEYCDYIINLITNYKEYEALALSAYNEYVTRLNWSVASRLAKQYISEVI